MNNGFIFLHRSLLDSEVFASQKILKVWIWCLLKANFKDKFVSLKVGKGERTVKVERGQFIFGRLKAEQELGIKGITVYRVMKKLEKLKNISLNSYNQYSLVTINNYNTYQDVLKENEQPMNSQETAKIVKSEKLKNLSQNSNNQYSLVSISEHNTYKDTLKENEQPMNSRRTADEQPMNTTNKDNKEKKGNNTSLVKEFSKDSTEYRLSKLLFDLIKERDSKHKKPNLQTWAKQIDLMIRIDKRSEKEIEDCIRWAQNDSFWQNNILSTSKLRKQFDQLYLKSKTPQNTANAILGGY